MKIGFDNCNHVWKFHIDVDKAGGPATGNTIYMCEICKHLITLREKAVLDSLESTKISLIHQERSLENAKIATYIAAGALCLSAVLFSIEKFI